MKYILALFLISNILICEASDTINYPKSAIIIHPEFMRGIIYENYNDFPPHSKYSNAFLINIGIVDYSSNRKWTSFYNYPQVGLSLAYVNPGNDSVFGKEYFAIPYVEFFPAGKTFNRLSFKFGLGSSYFTKYYNRLTNLRNEEIGSHFNFAFLAFMYFDLFRSKKFDIEFGAGYLHSSNGHMQLPNYGLNSGMLSISGKYMLTGESRKLTFPNRPLADKTKHYFLSLRTGIGLQEFGSAKGPAGSPKKPVYSVSTSAGVIFRQCIKVEAGFTYRYYKQQYDFILNRQTPGLIDNPKSSASNVFFYLGCELLFSNISFNIDGGVNIYKPFFENFYLHNGGPKTLNTKYYLKRIFPSRMGLKAYLFNTAKMPANNYFISAHINADFGQADFSEISFGYVKLIK